MTVNTYRGRSTLGLYIFAVIAGFFVAFVWVWAK
jgi:hypothetical protein